MRTWCPPNSNPSDDLTSDLDRESSPKYQHLIVHFAEGLQGRHLIDQLSKFRRWAPETRGRIGLFPATINRMGPGPIGSAHSAKDTGSVYNRHTYPVTVFVASIQRSLDCLGGLPYRQYCFSWQVIRRLDCIRHQQQSRRDHQLKRQGDRMPLRM